VVVVVVVVMMVSLPSLRNKDLLFKSLKQSSKF